MRSEIKTLFHLSGKNVVVNNNKLITAIKRIAINMKEVIKLRRKIKIWVICKSSYNAINNHSRINSSIDMHAS